MDKNRWTEKWRDRTNSKHTTRFQMPRDSPILFLTQGTERAHSVVAHQLEDTYMVYSAG